MVIYVKVQLNQCIEYDINQIFSLDIMILFSNLIKIN